MPCAVVDCVLTLDQSGKHLPCDETLHSHFDGLKRLEVIALKINEQGSHSLARLEGEWKWVDGGGGAAAAILSARVMG